MLILSPILLSACSTYDDMNVYNMNAYSINTSLVNTLEDKTKQSYSLPIGSRGGRIASFILREKKFKKNGTKVRIGGNCDSACTLYLGLPRNQLCLLPGARFRFHKAWGGAPRANAVATKYLINNYPNWVRTWISRNGGLTGRFMTMDYEYARKYIASCEETPPKAARPWDAPAAYRI